MSIAMDTPGLRLRLILLAGLLAWLAPGARAAETLLLQDPSISADQVVFRYAEDLWIVSDDGGEARRLTSSPGSEFAPQLSPDGRLVAFTGQYEGNSDVYVISVDGGAPRRLTWHPGQDRVLDWMPDGSAVVFLSSRTSNSRVAEAWTVSLDGGQPERLELPKVGHLSVDAEASRFAYTPLRDAFTTWKRYRGGRVPPVWIFDRASQEVEEIPHDDASDTFPCWVGDRVYFASDRDGVMNLFRYRPGGGPVEQLTRFDTFHIRAMDSDGKRVVFEQAGRLQIFDPAGDELRPLNIVIRADGLAALPRWQKVAGHVRNAAIAPNGMRAVFEARGEIITLPREHGDARNLSASPGVHDRSPIWSPDGERIAWFNDESGEYRLVVRDRLGREDPEVHDPGEGGFFYAPQWSPDGEHILFFTKSNRIAYLTLDGGKVTEVDRVAGSLGVVYPDLAWSADSKWIAYTQRNPATLYDRLALYNLDSGKTRALTDDFAVSLNPAFSPDGKYLYFTASVNLGPKLMGLNMGTAASRDWDSHLYVAVLQTDADNPLFPKSDDAVEAEIEDDAEDEDEDDDEDAKEEEESLPALELENLDQRILALPLSGGNYHSLNCAEEKLLYMLRPRDGDSRLESFDFDKREAETLVEDLRAYWVSADGKQLLIRKGSAYSLRGIGDDEAKPVAIDAVKVRVEPETEWPQILREVWRIERDYFYDPKLHGVDWDAMWERWSAFLPHVKHREDLTVLVREMIGELSCGHEYVWGGESPDPPEGVSVGLLGADWEAADDHYRIARILRGQNWNPGARAPLTEPGVDARIGDYLIAINGRPVSSAENLYRAFENTAGKQTEITLSTGADGRDARSMQVLPLAGEWGLRFRTWVEDNRRRVEKLSDGRLAYVYMRDTGNSGRAEFDRDFYSQVDREGLILDERYNGGGKVADYVIEVLSRKTLSYWMNREQWLGRTPLGVMEGPKVMVINESAGSGGDWMPWAFRQAQLGPLVGTRTWGGLVGITGYPSLVDGGYVTAASFGVMDLDGNWVVENVGVPPDHEVVEYPKDIIAGKDPQLEKAVALALEALEGRGPAKLPVYTPPAAR